MSECRTLVHECGEIWNWFFNEFHMKIWVFFFLLLFHMTLLDHVAVGLEGYAGDELMR
jgi:hypothetical protein